MTDADLIHQMREVIRGLKPDGVFAMQFSYRTDGEHEETEEFIKRGGVSRTLEAMKRMVESVGGRVAWSERIATFPDQSTGWYGVHIQRN